MAEAIDVESAFAAPASATAEPAAKPTFTIEEDESSLSSSGTDLFDRSTINNANHRTAWSQHTDGTWHRNGSSESTATGVTSLCSSVAADDKSSSNQKPPTPTRKRTADGLIKHTTSNFAIKAEAATKPPQPDEMIAAKPPIPQQTVPKRRGRPPKDKSALVGNNGKERRASAISRLQGVVRPKSALPTAIPKELFASQCIEAAHASRLDPFALHSGEHHLLAHLLMNKEVTVYLNIRNAILRLWHQNPLCAVTIEEAAGCAKDGRFFGLCEAAYKWLTRYGYINFGCVELPKDPALSTRAIKNARQKTVVVVGAGVSGLTAARQLEGLFLQTSERWTDVGECPPKVVVLEGRDRIGGRVHSKQLRSQVAGSLPGKLRNTAEMGAMIVTGFDHGNPLNVLIRGQLGLRHHMMTDDLTIYDVDGNPVDEERDMMTTELYTDISNRAGDFRAVPQQHITLKGDEELINRARDPPGDGFEGLQIEPLFPIDMAKRKQVLKRGRRRNAPPGTEKLTGKTRVLEESNATQSAARAAKGMGWDLHEDVSKNQTVSLYQTAHASQHPTLGAVMDEAIEQYKELIDLTDQDMRLLNWHHANLEYANAAPVSSLSLSGHDQDTGNEFEGAHSEIVGGYTQLPRGLMKVPTELDVRLGWEVDSIHYNADGWSDFPYSTKIVSKTGEIIEADEVVVTAPLGVLKSDMMDFDPPLPPWKEGAIKRMGFGLLNKLILLYDKPFWDDDRDMFGFLNEAEIEGSLDPTDYAAKRGRFYLIWNATKISGRPMLVALLAGNSAFEAEQTESQSLVDDVTKRLRKTWGEDIPAPLEFIVSRWKKDPFTRGTYSYVGPETRPGDYDLMAKPVGNLHFAGEATCGTHPATVHGALLSGLRVAADVMDRMAGPIHLPSPLVLPAEIKPEILAQMSKAQDLASLTNPQQLKSSTPRGGRVSTSVAKDNHTTHATQQTDAVKQEQGDASMSEIPFQTHPSMPGYAFRPNGPPRHSVCAGDDSFWVQPEAFDSQDMNYEAAIIGAILSELGERPAKPHRPGVNPFLVFTKDKWEEVKSHCSKSTADAGRDLIRQTIGKRWRAASEEEKAPYLAASQAAQVQADSSRREWEDKAQTWDEEARRIRKDYCQLHPPPVRAASATAAGPAKSGGGSSSVGVSKRKTNTSNCVVLDHL
ncbi:hypothetical protein KC345_g4585 [Hortaea werneckii]|nr:hypothetical protein KC345_g4585 [Hortaea werneckii]